MMHRTMMQQRGLRGHRQFAMMCIFLICQWLSPIKPHAIYKRCPIKDSAMDVMKHVMKSADEACHKVNKGIEKCKDCEAPPPPTTAAPPPPTTAAPPPPTTAAPPPPTTAAPPPPTTAAPPAPTTTAAPPPPTAAPPPPTTAAPPAPTTTAAPPPPTTDAPHPPTTAAPPPPPKECPGPKPMHLIIEQIAKDEITIKISDEEDAPAPETPAPPPPTTAAPPAPTTTAAPPPPTTAAPPPPKETPAPPSPTTAAPSPTTEGPPPAEPKPELVKEVKEIFTIFDKLTEANAEISKGEEASLVKAGKLLASAGKTATKIGHDFIKKIDVEEHFGFLSTILNEFVAFEATGAFEAEEIAAQTIADHMDLIDICEYYVKKFMSEQKEVVETKEVHETFEFEVEARRR